MQTYNVCIISEDSQESWSSQEDPYGVILISESLCTSKETSGLYLLKGTASVYFLGSLRLPRIQLENCKEISLAYKPCHSGEPIFFVNQDICKCFISFGPDSSITNALLCGADDVSAQTAHWDSINYTGRIKRLFKWRHRNSIGGYISLGKEGTPMLQKFYKVLDLFLFHKHDTESFIHFFFHLFT